MNIMVDKETCVKDINKFIQAKSLDNAVILLKHLCDIKDVPNKEEAVNMLSKPALISMLIPRILEQLEIEFKLIRITDKNNTLILVY